MFEKVNPSHPDKIADRIAGAIVDLAYSKQDNPKIAVEVLIGHKYCHIIIETSVLLNDDEIAKIVYRIAGSVYVDTKIYQQDGHLSKNQRGEIRCGDNGIFKGAPVTEEQRYLSKFAHNVYETNPHDGKYIIDNNVITVCQSNDYGNTDYSEFTEYKRIVNPLGPWTGGINVDTGATNRKLGSDMGDSVTGGGLHGKDLSKADVTLNICAYLDAQLTGKEVQYCCSIGDELVNGIPYKEYVEHARAYIESVGGFEKFAEWGLI